MMHGIMNIKIKFRLLMANIRHITSLNKS